MSKWLYWYLTISKNVSKYQKSYSVLYHIYLATIINTLTYDSYFSLVIKIIELYSIESQTSIHQFFLQLTVCQPKHFRFRPISLNLHDYGRVAIINMIMASQPQSLSLWLSCHNPMDFGCWAIIFRILADNH